MTTIRNIILNAIIIVLLVIGFAEITNRQPAPAVAATSKNLNELQKQGASSAIEMNKYLTTIAFVIIGLLGNIVLGEIKLAFTRSLLSLIAIMGSSLLALASIYFGYLGYLELFNMFSVDTLNLLSDRFHYCQKNQFYTLIISAAIFILFLFNVFLNLKKQ